jgi:hypothetical protein
LLAGGSGRTRRQAPRSHMGRGHQHRRFSIPGLLQPGAHHHPFRRHRHRRICVCLLRRAGQSHGQRDNAPLPGTECLHRLGGMAENPRPLWQRGRLPGRGGVERLHDRVPIRAAGLPTSAGMSSRQQVARSRVTASAGSTLTARSTKSPSLVFTLCVSLALCLKPRPSGKIVGLRGSGLGSPLQRASRASPQAGLLRVDLTPPPGDVVRNPRAHGACPTG